MATVRRQDPTDQVPSSLDVDRLFLRSRPWGRPQGRGVRGSRFVSSVDGPHYGGPRGRPGGRGCRCRGEEAAMSGNLLDPAPEASGLCPRHCPRRCRASPRSERDAVSTNGPRRSRTSAPIKGKRSRIGDQTTTIWLSCCMCGWACREWVHAVAVPRFRTV